MSLSPSYMIPLYHFCHDRQHPVERKEKERLASAIGKKPTRPISATYNLSNNLAQK